MIIIINTTWGYETPYRVFPYDDMKQTMEYINT